MDKVKDRGFSLEFIESYADEPSVLLLEFMKGCKILEARANEGKYLLGTRMPEGVSIEYRFPSFMVEREGNHYVIAIDSFIGWTLFQVRYKDQ